MTIREFWHDIRERLSDDHHPRREWRDERGRNWDRDRWQRSIPDTTRGPQNWRPADNRIREDICELMTDDAELDPSDVEVQVKDGEVTLTGTVESRRDKRHAEELAEQVSGVSDVHNRLQVHRGRDTFLGTPDALAGSSMGNTTRQ